ncbi:acetyl-CoA decarbonylase/synthase complex subunit gamma [Sporomusa acidovorans]|uniref:Corrinoid/iron-sulfur protein large subunit n=1 Tax=Sporomusa acidovorans (strain ATCC 49682 / DSM 3132 / Mol) TaxID=1123286 RepID=A0ABZ3J5N1_SPOA4|nr:acetyl-CoA decarbonylase/synthase complex subunit gamma [Sporomusa acidovorans]OZC23542.1 corrinoid/iron-sulfur protein large subunit [Sporomusa acidovorans DSM 3132]SDF46815.1 CO-methylating acetyl-CoA synthase corrinoid iron-sulfur protein large subunit precursor [Sporomusa acidovorans]
MALSGLDIFKQLPKTNCKECGMSTCLAFAMALASGKTSLDKCLHVSEKAKGLLDAAFAPAMQSVKIGVDPNQITLGGETVLFRHDKTFINQTAIVIKVSDTLSPDELWEKVKVINKLNMKRMGRHIGVDAIAITNCSQKPDKFKAAVDMVAAHTPNLHLVLLTEKAIALEAALPGIAERKPLVGSATIDNWQEMAALARRYAVPLIVKGNGLNATADLVELVAGEYKELVIDPGTRKTAETLTALTDIRRLAIKKKFRPFGFPTIAFTTAADPNEEIIQAGVFVAKYASAVVIKALEKAHILPLLTLRMNIYTDPQKPIAVEPKVYEIGAVTPESPVYVCTNFSLTYYAVEGEVAASKIPGYIIAVDTEGNSVLSAWASGRFDANTITEFILGCGIAEKVKHRTLVIPGYVAVISGKLQEKSGWDVIVGPQEAVGIPVFAKAYHLKNT